VVNPVKKKHTSDNTRRLSGRDQDIIEHVARYRLSVLKTIQRHFFPKQELSAVCKVVQPLCDEKWLARYPLIYPTQYFVPGKRAANALGLPANRTHPLGPQSLPTDYAVLQYAAKSSAVNRLLKEELLAEFPWYDPVWALAPHCRRVVNDTTQLELVRVDLGGPADHVARKCLADIKARLRVREFTELLKAESFRLVVISATTEKAAAIQLALKGHLWPAQMRFHLVVIPELLPLLPRCTDAT
jgi:hypothetical protein